MNPETKRRLRLLFSLFRPRLAALAAGFAALLAVDAMQLFIPRVIRDAVDGIAAGSADAQSLFRQGLVIAALGCGVFVCRYGWRRLILGASRQVERDLRARIFDAVLGLDAPFFHKNPPGSIVALASNDLNAVQMACGMGLVALVDAVVMTLACIGFMLAMHPFLTLIAVAPLPFLALATALLSARLHHRFAAAQKRFAELSEFCRQSFAAIRLVKAAGIEARQTRAFGRIGRSYIRDNLRLATVQGTLFPFSGLVGSLCLLLVLLAGGRLVIAGAVSVGELVAFISYLFMLTWPMMAFGWVAGLFQRGMTSLSRIMKVLDSRPVMAEPSEPLPLPAMENGARIELFGLNLDSGPGRRLLEGIELSAGPGLLGIAGPTGAGKSLIAAVIARILPVADGCLFINGVDANRISPAAWRGLVAFVPQHSLLFADTVRANIALGRPDADLAEIEAAARAAAIHDEIMAMPAGYETGIGERGVSLSGGQKQRLALARAILSGRPVLVMDDPLSAVDAATEQEIIANLREIFRNRTCIVASHRFSLFEEADQVVVIERGRVTDRGSHRELAARNPWYARVAARQAMELNP